MFIVRVAARAKDGAQEQFLQVLREQIEEVPRRYPLCHTYRACVDAVDPQAVLVYEVWVSREAYVEFSRSDYVAQVMSQLSPLMSEQDAAFYEAEPAELPLA
ncbi:MAG TPA: antibiotic biosynthesis monooxygenase [Ornithinimicrobium sp.]|uniref:putative quinol monooxygenase n=1 Tax=Ornithinimicrobium sp. TaxID=1977084 RepID=UPI002B49A0BA|nr:antibiotic biosynthesis monooxygenase [Ornithinimicrobium sp.]HKJ11216.1 antibiotic biosynthesis monooxygenase [Ornithinimicrobium sp.]